ncbi:MAG: hypothetical protein ACE361_12435 [Aureliella sp.]
MAMEETENLEGQAVGLSQIPIAITAWTVCSFLAWFCTAIIDGPRLPGDLLATCTLVAAAVTLTLHVLTTRHRGRRGPELAAQQSSQLSWHLQPNLVHAGVGLVAILNWGGAAANCSSALVAFLPSVLILGGCCACLVQHYYVKPLSAEQAPDAILTPEANAVLTTSGGPASANDEAKNLGLDSQAFGLSEVQFEQPTKELETAPDLYAAPLNAAPQNPAPTMDEEIVILREAQSLLGASGQRTASGCVNSELDSSEKSAELVLAFDPPFKVVPDLEFELTDENLQARILNQTCSGVRFAIRRLQTNSVVAIPFTLEWFASERSQSAQQTDTRPISTNLP